jgi:hypothetical protein
LSADAEHAGSTGEQADIDAACKAAGLWPDLVLSGHAHLYQRFTRTVGPNNQQTPYITAGSGGYAATPPQVKLGPAPITVGDHTLEIDPIVKFGYLVITCDARTLSVSFRCPVANGKIQDLDAVSVILQTGELASGSSAKTSGKSKSSSAKSKSRGKTPPTRARGKKG